MRARVLIRVAVAAIVFGATAMVSVATAPVAPAVPPGTDVCTAAGGSPGTTANPGELTCTFSSPGNYVLALGTVTSALSLDVWGAAGGGVCCVGIPSPEPGGNGAEVRATLPAGGVNVLQIGIGSKGASPTSTPPGGPGTPGGGAGGRMWASGCDLRPENCIAGGGGGLSEVASGDVALVVAGAGGGAGLGGRLTPGGNAGSAGPDGFVQNSDTPAGGGGAALGSSPGAGGSVGSCTTVPITGQAGTAGSGTRGGAGGSAPNERDRLGNQSYFAAAGGGGGAGYAGGGGGGPGAPGSSASDIEDCADASNDGAGGGGGGSSFVTPDASSSSILDGASAPSTGDGAVTVTYTPLAAPVFNGCTPIPPNRAGFVACTYLTPGNYSAAIPADAVDVTETVIGAPGGGPGGGRGALATGELGTAPAGTTLGVAVGGAGPDGGQQATTVSVGSETVDVSQGWTLNVASSLHFGSGSISIGGQAYTVASVTGPTSIAISGPQFVEPSEFVYIPSGSAVSQVAAGCTTTVAGGYPNGASPGCGAAGGGGWTRVSGGVPVGMIAGGGGGSGEDGAFSTPGPGGNAGSAGTASGSVPGGAGGGGGGGAGTTNTPGAGGAGGSCGPGAPGGAGSGGGAGGAGGWGSVAPKGGGGGGGGAGFAGGGGGGQGGGTTSCTPAGGGGGGGGSSFLPSAAEGSAVLDGADAPITGLPNGAAFITYALAPEVTGFTGPTTLQKAQFGATFGRPVMGVTTSTFTIVEVGGNNITGVVSCRNESSGPVSCATGPATTATFTTTKPIIAGEYYFVNINPATSPPGVAGYPDGELAPAAQGYERAPTAASAFQYPVKYQWGKVKKAKALGGSYVQEQFPGATLTFTTTSSSIGLVMWDGPDGGTASVTMKTKGSPTVSQSIDTYASKAQDATTTISGLNNALHTVTITVDGAHDPSSTNSFVRLDGTVLDSGTDATPATTAMWPNYPGAYAYTGTKGATVSFRFRGTGVEWTALTGPNDGQAQVTMDGNPVTQDLYAPGYGDTTFTYNTYDGFHTIVVKTLHTKNGASSDFIVTVEGFNAL